jgi:hypothetical protein
VLGTFTHAAELIFEFFKLLVRQFFQINELIARAFKSTDELVQLEMHCFGVAVLCVLDQEYHKEGDDGRRGIDDQLPCVGEMKHRPSDKPDDNDEQRRCKSPCTTKHARAGASKNAEPVADNAEKIALFFVIFKRFSLRCHNLGERGQPNMWDEPH